MQEAGKGRPTDALDTRGAIAEQKPVCAYEPIIVERRNDRYSGSRERAHHARGMTEPCVVNMCDIWKEVTFNDRPDAPVSGSIPRSRYRPRCGTNGRRAVRTLNEVYVMPGALEEY